MVKSGVNAFNIPASEPSIFNSAMQNKKAGKKLPSSPDRRIMGNLSKGIFLNAFAAKGNRTKPALNIRNAATCDAVKDPSPTFIS